MIPTLSAIWAAAVPAVGNHLWQSTLCLIVAGLLTLVLRKNHAQVRYSIWLAASLKFLIPFSFLIALGTHMATPRIVPQADAGLFVTIEQVGQPFAPAAARLASPTLPSASLPNLDQFLPAILAGTWCCGFLLVFFLWYARWRHISVALRRAVPLREGREVEIVRRLEPVAGVRNRIELLLSPDTLEPGVFGIVKPVLIWPKGISKELQDAHLEAILAHELWHVRRRDNLAAAAHMIVEAIFWFHPMVWWLGSRLLEERERACDEQVLQLGSERHVYATVLLKICNFCVSSPLVCVSGVSGADLKRRIVRIMTEHGARKLDFHRKLLLGVAALAVVAVPVIFGMAYAPLSEVVAAIAPRFEVVTIKPYKSDPFGHSYGFSIADPPCEGTFSATDVTVKQLVGMAYGVQYSWQIRGAPTWLDSETFDIQAKTGSVEGNKLKALSADQGLLVKHRLLQALLADRFGLTLHRTTKALPVYVLVVAKNGPKLEKVKLGDMHSGAEGRALGAGNVSLEHTEDQWKMIGQAIPLKTLVEVLMSIHVLDRPVLDHTGFKGNSNVNTLSRLLMDLHILRRPVLDQTGLQGNYDINLHWTSDQSQGAMTKRPDDDKPKPDNANSRESSGPSLFSALQEQLGLKLEFTKAPVEVVVIDHVERPAED